MNDARRYRMNAAECLLAAKTCEPAYRSVILAISAAWYALAVQDEKIDRLLAKWELGVGAGARECRDFGSDLGEVYFGRGGRKPTPGLSASGSDADALNEHRMPRPRPSLFDHFSVSSSHR
jgi:hypothetical protein